MTLTAQMVTIDCADPVGLAKFWTEVAGYELPREHDGDFVVLAPAWGEGVRIALQRVAEPKLGKNRLHVDWAADDRAAEVKRIVGLGATVVAEHSAPGVSRTVLADPEGNEFCVFGHG